MLKTQMPQIGSAADLIGDREALASVLTAFGMGDRLDQRALLRQVLEQGPGEDALARRIGDPRLIAFAQFFADSNGGFPVVEPERLARLADQYAEAAFVESVAEVSPQQSLALQFDADVAALLETDSSERTLWFRILGSVSLRDVFATALNVPVAVGALEIDRQADIFAAQFQKFAGDASLRSLADPAVSERMLSRFFLLSPQGQSSSGVTSPALQILQAGQASQSVAQSLLLSRLG
ncbi:DUF1217 domain-containing protein [Pontivivens insulae]|uniref:DUF1217 domain-containing protein n=1 Tax=Pontivivens insulae TaxID=1639689 RepID=UPI0013C2F771|nr:DUF1217 domain-containing protein [Pontivivens insulae]